MARKIVRKNEEAGNINPLKSGIRTGNPQLEEHEEEDVRVPPRQRGGTTEPEEPPSRKRGKNR